MPLLQVIAIGTDSEACKQLEKSFKDRVTTAVCDAKDMKQVGGWLWGGVEVRGGEPQGGGSANLGGGGQPQP